MVAPVEKQYTLAQLVDLPALRKLMESFARLADIQLSMLDPEGRLVVGANWQSICSRFHRSSKAAYQRCVESDLTTLRYHQKHGLGDGKTPVEYVCQNGMGCVSLPVIIDQYHVGDLFFSQFFTEPPDETRFIEQAREFGFDEAAYLESVREVKVRNREEVRQMLDFMHQLVQLVAALGAQTLHNLQAREAERLEYERYQRQTQTLLTLNQNRHDYLKDLDTAFPEILSLVATGLGVERVNVWFYSKDRQQILCRHSFGATPSLQGAEIQVNDCPGYFSALKTDRGILVEDAVRDPRTAPMAATYLEPNRVGALLDAALWRGDEMIGVICCEHVGGLRSWHQDEEHFSGAAADLISQLLETSRRQRVELALKESERRMSALMDQLPGIAYRCTGPPDWHLTFVSQGVEEITGYPASDFLRAHNALSLDALVHEDDRGPLHREILKALVDQRSFEVEYRITNAEGDERWLWEQGHAVRAVDSKELLVEGFISDITEQKRIEQFKEEMLSVVSHEMRTPLTSLLGFTELLLEHDLSKEQVKDILQTVHGETDRLREMVENLLDLQQLRAGRMHYSMQKVHLKAVCEELLQLYRPLKGDHPLFLECDSELPPIFGDPVRLFQILRNLISNAFKYSPAGSPVIFGGHPEKETALLWIQDEGRGIPKEQRDRIFDRFYRVESGEGSRQAGVGLGLALVQEMVEAHKGEVWVEDAPEKGSIFYLRLPLFQTSEEVG